MVDMRVPEWCLPLLLKFTAEVLVKYMGTWEWKDFAGYFGCLTQESNATVVLVSALTPP